VSQSSLRFSPFSFFISCPLFFFLLLFLPPPPISTLFPYTTLFRSPGSPAPPAPRRPLPPSGTARAPRGWTHRPAGRAARSARERSEEHTSELQSRFDLVCRLLLEKKNDYTENDSTYHVQTPEETAR